MSAFEPKLLTEDTACPACVKEGRTKRQRNYCSDHDWGNKSWVEQTARGIGR